MAEEEIPMETDAIALEDSEDTNVTDVEISSLIGFVQDCYNRAEDYRYQDEERWTRAYRKLSGSVWP